jgi:hypothetical protein
VSLLILPLTLPRFCRVGLSLLSDEINVVIRLDRDAFSCKVSGSSIQTMYLTWICPDLTDD